MSHPYNHALSSVRRHGGRVEDYIELHAWLDQSKEFLANFRHRALRHHAQGIFEAERIFGMMIRNADGRLVPTRIVAEQHVREDCGYIPTMADWLSKIPAESWMYRAAAVVHLAVDNNVASERSEDTLSPERSDRNTTIMTEEDAEFAELQSNWNERDDIYVIDYDEPS